MKTPKIRLMAECETRGETCRDVHTRGGFYLGTAATSEHALMWARSPRLLKLCTRAADGDTPSKKEFEEAIAPLLQFFKFAA